LWTSTLLKNCSNYSYINTDYGCKCRLLLVSDPALEHNNRQGCTLDLIGLVSQQLAKILDLRGLGLSRSWCRTGGLRIMALCHVVYHTTLYRLVNDIFLNWTPCEVCLCLTFEYKIEHCRLYLSFLFDLNISSNMSLWH